MKFYITFGRSHKEKNGASLYRCYTVIEAPTLEEARHQALAKFGQAWSSIYPAKEKFVIFKKLLYVKEPDIVKEYYAR